MVNIVSLHGCLELVKFIMYVLVGSNVNLGRCCPEHYNAVNATFFLEVANVLTHLLHHVPAVLALLYVVAIEALCIVLVESSLERLNLKQLVLYWLDVFLFKHLGVDGALIGICWIYVPSSKYDVVELCQRHDIFVM